MRILFVDDEPNILEGIERTLFHLSDQWEMEFAESGTVALQELSEGPYDVIVTDMRMPGMDGAALLREVSRKYPHVVRIILSGHAELEAAMRAIPVAHQFLTKPCESAVLEETVARACGLHAVLGDVTLRETVGKLKKLPSVPKVYSALTKALAEPNVDAQAIAKIVCRDTAMSAKTLQLVNSSFFSRGAAITDVREAVVRLGFQTVKNLVLSVEVFQPLPKDCKVKGFSIDKVQSHALHCAALAKKLIKDRKRSDDAFMAAMLHDAGKLVLAVEHPEKLEAALALAKAECLPAFEAERQLLSVSHAEVGAYLLGLWGLPYPIVEAVANHHDPSRTPAHSSFGIHEAVYVANCLSNGNDPDAGYLEAFGVADQLDRWRRMADELRGN